MMRANSADPWASISKTPAYVIEWNWRNQPLHYRRKITATVNSLSKKRWLPSRSGVT